MLFEKVTEPVATKWAIPIVLVSKEDGLLRIGVDNWNMNSISNCDSYPLLRMDESIDSLGEATVLSTLDSNSGY